MDLWIKLKKQSKQTELSLIENLQTLSSDSQDVTKLLKSKDFINSLFSQLMSLQNFCDITLNYILKIAVKIIDLQNGQLQPHVLNMLVFIIERNSSKVQDSEDNLNLVVDILLGLDMNLKKFLSPHSVRTLHDLVNEHWEDSLSNRTPLLACVKLLLYKSSHELETLDADEIMELMEVIVNNYGVSGLDSKHSGHFLFFIDHLWAKMYKRQDVVNMLASNYVFFTNFELLDCKENVKNIQKFIKILTFRTTL